MAHSLSMYSSYAGFTHYKVVLKNDDGSNIEIRRFDYDNQNPNFKSLCDKLKLTFPELQDNDFTVSWIDEDYDVIRITSNEELNTALEIAKKTYHKTADTCLLNRPSVKLYVRLNQKNKNVQFDQKKAVIHKNIICDSCNNTIIGFRYKCMLCEDFDLCSQCEALNLHPEHFMLRILGPLDWSTYGGRSVLDHIKTFLKRNYYNRKPCCHERKKEKQPEGDVATNEDIVVESPKRNTKLIDLTVIEPPPFSDNTFVSHNNTTSTVNPLMEEWTLVDKTDISPASSVSSNLNESSENNLETVPVTTTTTTATAPVTTTTPTSAVTSVITAVTTSTTKSANTSATASAIASATTSATASATTSETISATAPKINSAQQIYPQLPKESKIHHPNLKIHNALITMISMGFSNSGGVLTHLLETENGDINSVLDILEYRKS